MALTASATPLYVANFLAVRLKFLFIYCGIGYRTTSLASSVWIRTVFSNVYTPSTGPIYFTRYDAPNNIFSPAGFGLLMLSVCLGRRSGTIRTWMGRRKWMRS